MASKEIPSEFDPTIEDFGAIAGDYEGFVRSCRFAVRILPQPFIARLSGLNPNDLTYLCEVTEFPGRGFNNIDLRYYGPSQKLPIQTTYEDINMTFICRSRSLERQFFDDWQLCINPVNTYDFNYRDDYSAQIDIFQFGEFGQGIIERTPAVLGDPNLPPLPQTYINNTLKAQYKITLYDAYPILVNAQPVTWSDDTFQRLVVSFTYSKWGRKELDPQPRQSETGPGLSFSLVEGRDVNR